MIMTRDQMMGLMENPKIIQPKLDSMSNPMINEGQLIGKDKKVINTNAMIDERGRFIMKPKHV